MVLAVLATDGGGWKEAPLILDAELSLVLVDREMVMPLMVDVIDGVESPFGPGASGASKATIFIPRDSPVLAGINSVVTPFRLITVRWG